MRPVFLSSVFYTIQYTYRDMTTGITSKSEIFKVVDNEAVKEHVDAEFIRIKGLREQEQMVEISNVQIDSGNEVTDYTTIVGWSDARPGDYYIHKDSLNNVSSDIELGYDFYVAKLNRDQEVFVDKYFICWHAYQGCFIITRYSTPTSNDKENNTDVLTIYDGRLIPTLNTLETEAGRRLTYLKIAKYAQLFSIENVDITYT